MRHRRRWGRLRLTLGCVAGVATVFLLWQLLGVRFLAEEEMSALARAKMVYDGSLNEEILVTLPPPTQKKVNLLRGSRVVDIAHYLPSKDGYFRCMASGHEIQFEKVNDDFCDCPRDGSDEPGTSACSESGRFFCTYHQKAGLQDVWVPSGRVNDGVCDCCDGSDEWKNSTLPLRFKLDVTEQRRLGVFQSPCTFNCY